MLPAHSRVDSRTAFRTALSRGVVALALGAATLATAHASPGPEDGAQRKTITELRAIGTAMYSWYTDKLQEAAPAATPARSEGVEQLHRVDLTAIPVISREELAQLLVPRYLKSLPAVDGWGHPFEFRLNAADLRAKSIMAVRSAGADGSFSGETYEVGAFAPSDQAQDLVWVDGYFARWPKPAQGSR